MRLLHLTKCYILSPVTKKNDGEISTKWTYKGDCMLSLQQDINELDLNNAGYIDYEVVKARTDKTLDIEKKDGISLTEPEIDDDGYVDGTPDYVVNGYLKIGKLTTYTIKIYHGE